MRRFPCQPHRAFFHRAAMGGFERCYHLVVSDMAPPNVVQESVVGFAHQRIHRLDAFIAWQAKHIIQNRIRHARHIQRRRERDGSFDFAEFLHLRLTRQLPERIADEHRSRDLLTKQISRVRQDHRHSRTNRIGLVESDLADAHAADIGNRIKGAAWQAAGWDAEIGRTRAGDGTV